jgi:SagB-type dehydrogenase family enzyme
MKKKLLMLIILFFIFTLSAVSAERVNKIELETPSDDYIKLLNKRKSIRTFTNTPLTFFQLSYLLYSADARTPKGNRTAPSAGALYPIDIFVYVNNVKGLKKGIYFYNPRYHYVHPVKTGDFTRNLTLSALKQRSIGNAGVTIIMIYEFSRMKPKYGDKAIYFAHIEAGHISQNILLAAAKLEIGAVPIGAFNNEKVLEIFGFNPTEKVVLYINTIGNIK